MCVAAWNLSQRQTREWTCRRVLTDRPRLASQLTQTRHACLLTDSSESFPFRWTVAHRRDRANRTRVRVKNVPNTRAPATRLLNFISMDGAFSAPSCECAVLYWVNLLHYPGWLCYTILDDSAMLYWVSLLHYWVISPVVILCGWLGSKHQLTIYAGWFCYTILDDSAILYWMTLLYYTGCLCHSIMGEFAVPYRLSLLHYT